MSLPEEIILKLLTPEQWRKLKAGGSFAGSADDLRDGYIHLSLASQAEKTWRKHFGGRPDVVVVTLRTHLLGEDLRMEASGSLKLYPHLYRRLLWSDVEGHALAESLFRV